MWLRKARVQNYWSIKDSGWFETEGQKTILVGPNEAGKTALMRALEHLGHGPTVKPFHPLRDFPRSEYHRIQSGELDPKDLLVVEGVFELDDDDRGAVGAVWPDLMECRYHRSAYLDNTVREALLGAPDLPTVKAHKDELRRLAVHVDSRVPPPTEGTTTAPKPSEQLNNILGPASDESIIESVLAAALKNWLETIAAPLVDTGNDLEMQRLTTLRPLPDQAAARDSALALLNARTPVMVYYSNYTRVRPLRHLQHLADMIDQGVIDPTDSYNFGNSCLLRLLNFSARELSNLGRAGEPAAGDSAGLQAYLDQLDERRVRLNAASIRLTQQIKDIWQPAREDNRGGASGSDYTVRIQADQQYLKVVVEDSLGVEVELDQRSEGFQWLVSFFIVFFAQTSGAHANAILLLDEPGLSLHGLKQREFRTTLSRLAESNQLLFTTHSPFLVGPDELDLVRVVEMLDRTAGTIVHTEVVADDPASLLPLQEALGYDMAQSLFAQQRNLILEGLTDYWYVEATGSLLRAAGLVDLNESIALVPASGAGKVVYFATILHAHNLKVAALLDSDAAGEQAARQDTLVHTLGNKRILRTKDAYAGAVNHPEVEDLLRETLIAVGRDHLQWDITAEATRQPNRPITDVFSAAIGADFSKYRLAKAYIRWTREHEAAELDESERQQWVNLIETINSSLT